MMKKNGFTLAEVLITLAIIGVVATITLPALLTNTAEQQAKTALKKGINTFVEAAQMNAAIAGFDYASVNNTSTTDAESQSLYGILANRTSIDYGASDADKALVDSTAGNFVVFFRDGSAFSYPFEAAVRGSATATGSPTIDDLQEDGLAYGITGVYDTNGKKGPNLLSNCSGKTNIQAGNTDKDTGAGANCSDRSQRVIKDQFGIRLRGNIAVPNGAAARWAYEN